MDIHVCARCKGTFWDDEMSSHRSYCKPCLTNMQRDYKRNNWERYLESARRWRISHSDACRERKLNKMFLEPEKVIAVNALNHAVADGRLTRQPCEICCAYPTDAHHEDYSKPLDVRWLCPSCHLALHYKEKQSA